MQKAKALFDELVIVGWLVSLEDFNLYVFRGLRWEFKDLVTSLVTKAEPLSYADLYSHLLTHGFLHKTSLSSMGSVVINTPLLPTSNTPPAIFFFHRQSPRNFGRNRGRFHRGWCPNKFNSRGHKSTASRSDFHSLPSSSNSDGRQGNWQRSRGQNPRYQLCHFTTSSFYFLFNWIFHLRKSYKIPYIFLSTFYTFTLSLHTF